MRRPCLNCTELSKSNFILKRPSHDGRVIGASCDFKEHYKKNPFIEADCKVLQGRLVRRQGDLE